MLNFLRHSPKFLSFLAVSKQDKHSLDTDVRDLEHTGAGGQSWYRVDLSMVGDQRSINKQRVETGRSTLTMWGKRSCNRQPEAKSQPGEFVAAKEDVVAQRCGTGLQNPPRPSSCWSMRDHPHLVGFWCVEPRHQEGWEGEPHETVLSHHFWHWEQMTWAGGQGIPSWPGCVWTSQEGKFRLLAPELAWISAQHGRMSLPRRRGPPRAWQWPELCFRQALLAAAQGTAPQLCCTSDPPASLRFTFHIYNVKLKLITAPRAELRGLALLAFRKRSEMKGAWESRVLLLLIITKTNQIFV